MHMPTSGYLQCISPVIRAILFIPAMRPQFKYYFSLLQCQHTFHILENSLLAVLQGTLEGRILKVLLNIAPLLLCLNADLPMGSLFLLVLLLWGHSYNLVWGQIQISSLYQSPVSVSVVAMKSLFPFSECFLFHSSFNFLFKYLLRILAVMLRRQIRAIYDNRFSRCEGRGILFH